MDLNEMTTDVQAANDTSDKSLIPRGYKHTDLGVIPEDWNVKTIADVAFVKTGPFGSSLHERDYVEDGTPIITVEHLGESGILYDNLPKVSDSDRTRLSSFSLRYNDIVFSRVGSVDRNSLISENEKGWLFSGRLLRVRTSDHSVYSPYLSYHFHSEPFKQRVRRVAVGQTMASLNTKILKGVSVVLPNTLPEQRVIAEALGDVDELISKLDQFIAKKCNIKEAAMQQLLTGKKHLPGFSEKWEEKNLGEIGDLSSAGVDKKIRPNEKAVRLVNYMDVYTKDFIHSSDLNHVVSAPYKQAKRCSVIKGDVFFTPSSETRDDIGNSAVAVEDIPDSAYSYHVVRLRIRKDWDLRYRAYAFKTKAFYDQAQVLCDGSGTRYVISQGKFRSMKILVPPKNEQEAIAEILFDIDTEIRALKQRRDKTKLIKQGMMQELLTGKTRLI